MKTNTFLSLVIIGITIERKIDRILHTKAYHVCTDIAFVARRN